jgi:DNA (cytosine-5)-methyltransferase 1
MKFGSVCSGVEAASLAWLPLGWECKFVSEVEPFPCAVLQHRFGASAPINQLDPNEIIITDEEWALIDALKKVNKDWMKACDNADLISRFKERKQREAWIKDNSLLNKEGKIPNEGDFTKIGKKYAGQIDLLVGGTPCQDLSIAGKRAGFDGERSSLAIDFVRLAYESQCKWFVWENVPGVFSSNEGRDFATLLSLFTGSKVEVPKDGWGTAGFVCNARRDRYGVAWRTLDGQFTRTQQFPFAVPQRRRRVFVIGHLGDWTRAAEVLLEPGRRKWDTPTRFKARERVAEIARADSALADRALRGTGEGSTDRHWDASGVNPTLNQCNAGTLRANTHGNEQIVCGAFVQTLKIRSGCEGGGKGPLVQNELSATLGCGNDQTLFVVHGAQNPDVISMHNKQFGQCKENIASTLLSTDYKEPQVACYENHAQDSRVRELKGVSSQISAKAGTGGGNLPLVQECFVKTARPTFKGGCETYADTGVAPTVNTFDQGDKRANELICESICFAIDSVHSNSMKPASPNSGFHKEGLTKTLDTTDPNPTKNQGGNVIVDAAAIAFEPGVAKREGGDSRFSEELCGTLRSNMGDNQTAVAAHSTVRRLLPIECERLMGFPDNWTRIPWKGLKEEDCPDSPRYKACGNSMCVNVMQYLGEQIQKVEEENK